MSRRANAFAAQGAGGELSPRALFDEIDEDDDVDVPLVQDANRFRVTRKQHVVVRRHRRRVHVVAVIDELGLFAQW